MAKKPQNPEKFSDEEAADRFRAALRGARIAGHKPMESLPRKTPKAQKKTKVAIPKSRNKASIVVQQDRHGCVIGSIGNLYKNKGFEYLIEAMKILDDQGIEAKVVIIGEGSERKNLEELISKHNLKDKIILAGRIEKAAELLPAFDSYVCSSIKEGLSYTIIETMLNGLPIIATNVGGNPELIIDNVTGFLVEPQNSEALANKIKDIINTPDLQQDLSAKARIKAQEEFSLESMLTKTKKLYKI